MSQVVRGTEYTFTIRAGETHPFYITDDIIGGNSDPGEIIFAGGLDSFGSLDEPFVLRWTPDDDTPDLVYYQCFEHQKLGWEIRVSGGITASSRKERITFLGTNLNIFMPAQVTDKTMATIQTLMHVVRIIRT